MRFSFLAPLAILAVAVSAIPMSTPTKAIGLNAKSNDRAVRFDKRDPITSWIMGDSIDPALKEMEPAMRASWENVTQTTKVWIVASLPDDVGDTVAQVLGLKDIESDVANCPEFLEPICKVVFPPIAKFNEGIKLSVKNSISNTHNELINTLTNITMVHMKLRFLLEQDLVRDNQWSYSDWFKARLDPFISGLKADVKAPMHAALEAATRAFLSVAPADFLDKLEGLLADGAVVDKDSVVGFIRDQVTAMNKSVFDTVETKVESVMAELEANIMASFDEIVRKALAEMAERKLGKQ